LDDLSDSPFAALPESHNNAKAAPPNLNGKNNQQQNDVSQMSEILVFTPKNNGGSAAR
jgi:hypothetical protein